MTVTISGIGVAADCTITLDALSGQAGFTARWGGDVAIPDAPATVDVDGATVGGQWHPQSRTYTKSTRITTARFGLASRPEAIEGQLTDPAYLRSQLSRTPSPWHAHIARTASLAYDPPAPALVALSNLLLNDLPDPPASLADYTRALSDYQYGIDPASDAASLRIISLVATSGNATPPTTDAEWVRQTHYTNAATVRIECRYQANDGSIQTYATGSLTPPRKVELPAASRAEAYLEITLQRLRLLAEAERAELTIPLDLTISPGQGLTYDNSDWVIVRAIHTIGADRPYTTAATLRPVPPNPGAVPSDLATPAQRDMLNPP